MNGGALYSHQVFHFRFCKTVVARATLLHLCRLALPEFVIETVCAA
jgi:hypothetical protein